MRRLGSFVAVFLCLVLAAAPAAQAQKRVALVIGNSAYQHAGLLDNPKNDAIDVAGALKKHGFQVISGFDLDKVGMDRKIREFSEALAGSTSAVFFFAGHGLQVSGHNYLVPIDAKLTTAAALDWEMVRLDLVHRSMEREAATSILFVDACRNNPLARNLARVMGTRSAEIGRGLAPVEAGVGTLVSFSTQPGNVALDGAGRNSPFAGALVKHIHRTKDDLSNILIAVRNDVLKDTKGQQVPWEHSALTGRFYFDPTASVRPPPADEITWALIKDATDPALLKRFIDQFPESQRRSEAEKAAAALAAIAKPAALPPELPKKVEPPPPPRAAASDEVAWSLIKDSKDPAVLRRFSEQFPNSGKRKEAEQRAAALAAAAAAPSPAPPAKAPAGTSKSKCFSFEGRQFCP
jgi:uncharacterized caspase-like protein